MKLSKIEALEILDKVEHGVCKHCGKFIELTKDKQVEAHGTCPQEYPLVGVIRKGSRHTTVDLNAVAEIVLLA